MPCTIIQMTWYYQRLHEVMTSSSILHSPCPTWWAAHNSQIKKVATGFKMAFSEFFNPLTKGGEGKPCLQSSSRVPGSDPKYNKIPLNPFLMGSLNSHFNIISHRMAVFLHLLLFQTPTRLAFKHFFILQSTSSMWHIQWRDSDGSVSGEGVSPFPWSATYTRIVRFSHY